jgi:HEAT repeat protein
MGRSSAFARSPRHARPIALAALALTLAAPAGAGAQRKSAPPQAPGVDTRAIAQKVLSDDAAQALEALAKARDAGASAAQAAPAIEELLVRGANVPVAKAAIEALGAIGERSSSAIIRPYSKHRVPDLRREAVKSLTSTRGADAAAAFREGLKSSDGMVRGYSAAGLGILGAKEAVPDLFAALDRDVTEAAAALGQLCDPAACKQLLDRTGKIGFDVLTSGLDPMLFRKPPLQDDLLLDVVLRLRDLGTPEAGRYLADVQARWPQSASQAVKQAIDAAIASIPGAKP